jgi:glycosyltransferase involved in cell wall biosynthesis
VARPAAALVTRSNPRGYSAVDVAPVSRPALCFGHIEAVGGGVRTTCVITNYNYRQFVSEAIDSALGQTRPFDEIIVVDDASTDGSVEMLRSAYGTGGRVQLIELPRNGGQMAAFIAGTDASRGDIVFLLDADDLYVPDYVARAMAAYEESPSADFVYCAYRRFGKIDKLKQMWPEDRDLGYSVLRTYWRRRKFGLPTSTISLRRWVVEALRPSIRPDEWRAYADRCFAIGAGLIGAYKRYIAQPLVRYRVHDSGVTRNLNIHTARIDQYRRRLDESRFISLVAERMRIDSAYMLAHAYEEFETIPRPYLHDLLDYVALSFTRTQVRRSQFKSLTMLARHYLRSRVGA